MTSTFKGVNPMTEPAHDGPALPDSPAELIALGEAVAAKLNEVSFASLAGDDLLAAAEADERTRSRREAATTSLMIEINDQYAFHTRGFQNIQKYMTTGLRVGPP
ncbi:hypothetical protein ACFOJ6_00690 [Gordonia humi]